MQYWRVFYYRLDGGVLPWEPFIDIVAETADEARERANDLGFVLAVQDIAGLKPIDDNQVGRETKIIWAHPTAWVQVTEEHKRGGGPPERSGR